MVVWEGGVVCPLREGGVAGGEGAVGSGDEGAPGLALREGRAGEGAEGAGAGEGVGGECLLTCGAWQGGVDVRDEDLFAGGDGEEGADLEGEGVGIEVVGRVRRATARWVSAWWFPHVQVWWVLHL